MNLSTVSIFNMTGNLSEHFNNYHFYNYVSIQSEYQKKCARANSFDKEIAI